MRDIVKAFRRPPTGRRGDRLRFGFGLYHDDEDIDRLCRILASALYQ